MRDWYFCWQAGLIRQLSSAGPPPHRHEYVAFLPFGSLTIIALKPKEIFETPESLSDHLYQHRKKSGLFQREVAIAMEVALHNYIEWERGACHPRPKDWPRVICYLGFDPIEVDGSLGQDVEALVRRLGISQAVLAQKLGIHRDTLRAWINEGLSNKTTQRYDAQDKLRSLLNDGTFDDQ